MRLPFARAAAAALACASMAGCGDNEVDCGDCARPANDGAEAATIPEVVNGWREYPLREGVVRIESGKWQTDDVEFTVPAGEWLEYKLAMKAGETVMYSIAYIGLSHPGLLEVEFHGHTEKDADGTGDLMFYSRTAGISESGSFTAPWDGVHGWYIKNDGAAPVTARLELAGYYDLVRID